MRQLRPDLDPSVWSYDPQRQLQAKIDTLNATPGDMTGTDCPKCKNRGFYATAEDGRMLTRECGCMALRRCVWKMEASGLKDVMREYTFGKFLTPQPWQEKAKAIAMDYAANPQGWFAACGQSGSGKSHLCTAICRRLLLEEREVVYMPWQSDSSELKSLRLDSEKRTALLARLKGAQYLYVDDLFKTPCAPGGHVSPTNADVMLAFEILNHRYLSKKPTLISTELSPQELGGVDEAVAGRILELAGRHILHITRDPGKNYRLKDIMVL